MLEKMLKNFWSNFFWKIFSENFYDPIFIAFLWIFSADHFGIGLEAVAWKKCLGYDEPGPGLVIPPFFSDNGEKKN